MSPSARLFCEDVLPGKQREQRTGPMCSPVEPDRSHRFVVVLGRAWLCCPHRLPMTQYVEQRPEWAKTVRAVVAYSAAAGSRFQLDQTACC